MRARVVAASLVLIVFASTAATAFGGVPAILGAPAPTPTPEATIDLDDAITRYAGELAPPPPPMDQPVEAGYLYARARQATLEGEPAAAIELLVRAIDLAPGDPAIHATLAESLLATGDGQAAQAAFVSAVEAGSRSPRVLMASAIGLNQVGEHARAASMLSTAIEAGIRDHGLDRVSHAALSTALQNLGHSRAAAQAARVALRDPSPEPTRYGPQLDNLARQSAALWTQAAGMHLRAGEHALAIDAWERAQQGVDAGGLFAGRVARSWLAIDERMRTADIIADAVTAPRATLDDDLVELAAAIEDQQARRLIEQAAERAQTDHPHASSVHVQSWLVRVRAAASENPADILMDRLDRAPFDRRTATALLRSVSPEEAAPMASRLGRTEPDALVVLTEALLAAHPDNHRLVRALADREDAASAQISARLLVGLDRPRDALELLERGASTGTASWHATQAVVAAEAGEWAMARESALSIDASDAPHLAIEALSAIGDRSAALAVDPTAEAAATSAEAARLAQIARASLALRMGLPVAETLLLDLLRSDPFDPDATAALLAIYARAGEAGATRATQIVSQLNNLAPNATATRLAVARALADDQPGEVDRLYRVAFEREPTRSSLLDRLIELWTANEPRTALPDGRAWLDGLVMEHPRRSAVVRAAARLRTMLGDRLGAMELLKANNGDNGFPEITRIVEATLLSEPATHDEGRRLRDGRLAAAGAGVRATIERLVVESQDTGSTALEPLAALESLPASFELLPQERAPLVDAITRLAEAVAAEPTSAESERRVARVLAAVRWLDGRAIEPSVRLSQLRVVLIALAEPFDADAVVRTARRQGLVQANALAEASFRLNSAGRPGDVLAIMDRLPSDAVEPGILGQFAIAIAEAGGRDDAERWLALMPTADARARTLVTIGARPGDAPLTEPTDTLGAALAGLVASRMQTIGRSEPGLDLLRLAQSLVPEDPVLANNLAYSLAEAGVDLAAASQLAERAVESDPESASFVDTLGWVRYRQGRFAEALGLLTRASELEGGSVETSRQLGDTLWQLGREAEAIERWEEARAFAERDIADAVEANAPEPRLASLREQASDIADRLAAAARGEPPPIPGPGR